MSNFDSAQPLNDIFRVSEDCCRVFTSNRDSVEAKIKLLVQGGPKKLKIIADFDFTLSKFMINGNRGRSCHKILEYSGFLSDEALDKAKAWHNYYYPIEIDPHIPFEDKARLMEEWCVKAHGSLVENRITKSSIHSAVATALSDASHFAFRDHVDTFLLVSQSADIPVLVFSAGIADVLEHAIQLYVGGSLSNLVVLSNRCTFDDSNVDSSGASDPMVNGFEDPIIHVFNKKASTFPDCSFFHESRSDGSGVAGAATAAGEEGVGDTAHTHTGRCNLILLGDSTGDVAMCEGVESACILKIGFLNDLVDQRFSQYLQIYDVVVVGDPSFDLPLKLLSRIVSKVEAVV